MIRFTILADSRSAVMGAALVAIAALPLLVTPLADPYQPIRALVACVAAGLLVVSGNRHSTPRVRLARILGIGLASWVVLSAVSGGLASAVFGVHGRFQGLVSGAVLLLCGAGGLSTRGQDTRVLADALAVVGAVVSVAVFADVLTGMDPAAWMNNRVVAGGWLAVAAGVVGGRLVVSGVRRSPWLVPPFVVMLLALGVTASRGAWVGALAALALVALALRGRRRAGVVLVSFAVAVLVAAGAFAGGVDAASKLDPAGLSTGSALSRRWIWSATVHMIADHPVTGVGPGRYLFEFPSYQPIEHATSEAIDTRPDQAHSWPLQISAESGLPAGLLVLVLSGLVCVSALEAVRRRDAAALVAATGFAAYAAQSLFSVPSIEVDALGWLLGGVVVARAGGAGGKPQPWAGASRTATVVVSGLVAASCAVYLVADAAHTRALEEFARGGLGEARTASARAVDINPLTDTYRVALADSALYVTDPGARARAAKQALPIVEEGLRLEPRSYDLALSAARLRSASGESDAAVADAYLEAVERYPQGVEIRSLAADALDTAGHAAEAERLRAGVRALLAARGEGS